MATSTQIQTWLDEAEAARHSLATGRLVAEVWRDGRRITWTKQSLDSLNDYIATLRSELAAKLAEEAGNPRRSAIGIVY